MCGKDPAEGFAGVDGERFCHGDFDDSPTCYMRAQFVIAYVKSPPTDRHWFFPRSLNDEERAFAARLILGDPA